MNWTTHCVTEKEFCEFDSGDGIEIPRGVLPDNSGVELWSNSGKFANAIYDATLGVIRRLNLNNPVFKDVPNRDLMLYNDHLNNANITTVVVDGFFGTGKTATVCSHLVHGLMREIEGKKGITQAYVTKPHESLGSSYGHLPGSLEDKTVEEFNSFFQYFDRFGHPFLADKLMSRGDKQRKLLHIMVFEYLRGRDIESGWVILDEAQNADRAEMAALISRVGDGAKLIILGDSSPTQIDERKNSSLNNGLSFAKEIFKGKKYAGCVEMQSVKHILRGRRVRDLFLLLKGAV